MSETKIDGRGLVSTDGRERWIDAHGDLWRWDDGYASWMVRSFGRHGFWEMGAADESLAPFTRVDLTPAPVSAQENTNHE